MGKHFYFYQSAEEQWWNVTLTVQAQIGGTCILLEYFEYYIYATSYFSKTSYEAF